MPVDVGVIFPEAIAPGLALPDIGGLARLAERVGLDCLWASDRLTSSGLNVLDSSLTLAAAAAATERIAIGYGLYVPSLRSLAWAAKQVATLRHIAGERLRLGVGLGGGADDEYRAAGFRRADRVRRTDEFLELLPGLLGGHPTRIPDVSDAPALRLRPAVPVPPLWVGGVSPAALRRAARFGDGWLSGMQTPAEFAVSRRCLFELTGRAGRAQPVTGIGLHAAIGPRPSRELADVTEGTMRAMYGLPADRARKLAIAGTPAQVAERLSLYADAGAEVLAVVCDPVPSAQSWELLAEVRRLLHQR